jgi:hypothetical protein
MTAHPVIQGEPANDGRTRPHPDSRLVLGSILIVIGAIAALARAVDIDLGSYIGEQTWPLLVVVPGLALLALAFVRTPPEGLGFAIAGSIVTTVGAILLVQANTEAWASWAYVWALIPGAAGLGMAVYGLATRTRRLVDTGARMILIAGALFVVGWWYFGGLFASGEPPIDIATWWPLALIGVGVAIAARAWFGDTTWAHADDGFGSED